MHFATYKLHEHVASIFAQWYTIMYHQNIVCKYECTVADYNLDVISGRFHSMMWSRVSEEERLDFTKWLCYYYHYYFIWHNSTKDNIPRDGQGQQKQIHTIMIWRYSVTMQEQNALNLTHTYRCLSFQMFAQ